MRWFKRDSRIKKKFAVLPIRVDSEVRWLEMVYVYQEKDYFNSWSNVRFETKQEYLRRKSEEKETITNEM